MNKKLKGVGRLWFFILFVILMTVSILIPDWSLISRNIFSFIWGEQVDFTRLAIHHKLALMIIQLLSWNFLLAIITAPLFYFRIINIRLPVYWIFALAVPFVWAVLFIRCLVYQRGYTESGQLDEIGKRILKYSTYAIYIFLVLAVTYILADYL